MRFYRILLQKAYFDKGYALSGYFKVLIAGYGLASQNVKHFLFVALIYAIGCYIIGRCWYTFELTETENEINNYFNPFQREVRKAIKRKKFK